MLLENYYVVIQEALESKNLIQRVKTYHVPAGIHLIRLLSYLEKRSVCEFVFDIKGDQHRLSEKQLCSVLLEQPLLSIEDAFSKNTIENRTISP